VDSNCFGICPLISTELSTMAHTFAIVETYSFTKKKIYMCVCVCVCVRACVRVCVYN